VCRGWRHICDTCPFLWESVSDEEVDTSSPKKVVCFLWWCVLRAGAIRRLRLKVVPCLRNHAAHTKKREVASSLGCALVACGGALEELVLGNPWDDDLLDALPDYPHWVAPLKRLRTLEISNLGEAAYAPKLLYALRTHCPELRNLVLGTGCMDTVAAALFPLGLERLEFVHVGHLSPTVTQLTRLSHLRWAVWDPIEDWRAVAALTSLQTMAIKAWDEEENVRLPEEISALRNLRELSLELDQDYVQVEVRWGGLEVRRHALRGGRLQIRYLILLSQTALSPSAHPAAPGPPAQPDQALILRAFPLRVPPAPGGPHNPALPRPVGGGASR
jgi:hypothetical protein